MKGLHLDSSDSDSTSDSDSDTSSEKAKDENDETVEDMKINTDSEEHQPEKPREVYRTALPSTEDEIAMERWKEKKDRTPLTKTERIAEKGK